MSLEQTPTETPAPEDRQDPDAADAGPATRRTGRLTAILIACAIVALPVAYLAFHRADPARLEAATVPATAATASSIATLEAAVRENPTTDNRINLSQAYVNSNEPARAVPVLQAALAADPNNAIAWNNLCVAHTMQQDYKPALEECQHAVQLDPAFSLARNNLKWTQDEDEKTVQLLTTMERTAPPARDAKFYVSEGILFLHLGDFDQSIQAWQQALELDPNNAIAANDIGTSYMFKKQPTVGLQWFQRALAMDPTFQLAKNNLAWANDEVQKAKQLRAPGMQ